MDDTARGAGASVARETGTVEAVGQKRNEAAGAGVPPDRTGAAPGRGGEFDLIATHFDRTGRGRRAGGDAAAAPDPHVTPGRRTADRPFPQATAFPGAALDAVELGIGDDCALLRVAPGMRLAVSSDMLVEGRHFVSTVAPARLGHKALAVNLSDLAACGAEPLAFTLALALPRADEVFVAGFAQGLFALADAHRIVLAGGDTTAGPLTVCITVFGQVPPGAALLRSGARSGDDLWVSGTLGDARLALEVLRGRVLLPGDAFERVRRAMEQPQPRLALGMALRGVASSAIDLSDGLAGDLGHVLQRSGVGAVVDVDALPRSADLAVLPPALQRECVVAGGDDYELLFTAPPGRRDTVVAAGRAAGVAVTRCGAITQAADGLRFIDAAGHPVDGDWRGFDHFA